MPHRGKKEKADKQGKAAAELVKESANTGVEITLLLLDEPYLNRYDVLKPRDLDDPSSFLS